MTPQSEFVPIDTPISSSEQLELNFMDQQLLISAMKQTGEELETSPLAVPAYKEVILARIALLGDDGQRSKTDRLAIQFSESDKRRSAVINLVEGTVHTRLKLSPNSDAWEVWGAGSVTPNQIISNEQLVSELEPKLRNKEALSTLMDTVDYDSIMIPHLLATHLEKQAGRREKKLVYKINKSRIQGLELMTDDVDSSYIAPVNTGLMVYNNNGRMVHSLGTRAPYQLGATTIQKEYTYSAETTASHFYRSKGLISVSSADGYNEAQLANFASKDKFKNEPLFTLHSALSALRKHFGLPEDGAF